MRLSTMHFIAMIIAAMMFVGNNIQVHSWFGVINGAIYAGIMIYFAEKGAKLRKSGN